MTSATRVFVKDSKQILSIGQVFVVPEIVTNNIRADKSSYNKHLIAQNSGNPKTFLKTVIKEDSFNKFFAGAAVRLLN